eukprot:TRINITY_DN28567_c0_g1_i1.p1 TRINITY_DN28567_c0_g1~~TRINITY_DN28567_c0_g1_i1.p1  ORF type:complete len:819 (-),score=164.47 TRINITY_DN28567_c0_g1_i1:106-2562(-)
MVVTDSGGNAPRDVTSGANIVDGSVVETPAKRAKVDVTTKAEPSQSCVPQESSSSVDAAQGDRGDKSVGPPKFVEGAKDFVRADDGWWAHVGGQWLYNFDEKTYFHLPTGQLHMDAGDGTTIQLGGSSDDMLPEVFLGRVRWFNASKGFGFISPEDGGLDIFVHRNQLLDADDDIFVTMKPGERVSFTKGESDNGRECAIGVKMGWPEKQMAAAPSKDNIGGDSEGEGMTDEDEGDEGDASSSGSSVDIDLEEELKTGMHCEKGATKDAIEDFSVQKTKIPVSVLGETASCFFWGVFDGHGGNSCAEYAYNHLAKNILSRLRDRTKTASDEVALRTALSGAFKLTDHNFLQHARRVDETSGSTACTMTVFGPDEQMRLRLFLANIGDSRAVLGKIDGTTLRLTQDHKPCLPAEKKRIESCGGSVGEIKGVWRCILPPKRRLISKIAGLAVSRSFGDKDFKDPDVVSAEPEITIHEVDWDRDEFVILASDGIWDVVTDKMAVRLVQQCLRSKDGSEEKAAQLLVKIAGERGSGDDRTAIVVRFGWLKAKTEGIPVGNNDEDVEAASEENDEGKVLAADGDQAARLRSMAMAGMCQEEDDAEGEEEEQSEEEPCEDDDDDEPCEPTGLTIMPRTASCHSNRSRADDVGPSSGAATIVADTVTSCAASDVEPSVISAPVAPTALAASGEGPADRKSAAVVKSASIRPTASGSGGGDRVDTDDIFADGESTQNSGDVEEPLPAFLRVDPKAGITGVDDVAADPAGLFVGLGPTNEEHETFVGPARPSAALVAALAGKPDSINEEEACTTQRAAVDDDLDMFS